METRRGNRTAAVEAGRHLLPHTQADRLPLCFIPSPLPLHGFCAAWGGGVRAIDFFINSKSVGVTARKLSMRPPPGATGPPMPPGPT